MKNIIIEGVEYELTPVKEKNWTKQIIEEKTLEWGDVSFEKMSWEDAKKWCEEQGGRLPTSVELLQAYTDKVEGFAPASSFWSATAYTGGQGYAMVVYFDDGYVLANYKTNSYYVRCVRG
jgi:hypothetical protein